MGGQPPSSVDPNFPPQTLIFDKPHLSAQPHRTPSMSPLPTFLGHSQLWRRLQPLSTPPVTLGFPFLTHIPHFPSRSPAP